MSWIPLVLLLILCTSSGGRRHQPLGVTELSHYAHLIPIPLSSNCIYLTSVYHCLVGYCSHVLWSEYMCVVISAFVLRVLCSCYYGSHPLYCCVFVHLRSTISCHFAEPLKRTATINSLINSMQRRCVALP
jgi:hypothetical protein